MMMVVVLSHYPHLPETLPVVTKTGCGKIACRWKKPNNYEIVRTAVSYKSVRGMVVFNTVLWYTIAYHSGLTCDKLTPGRHPW